jgi:hypothetical protein
MSARENREYADLVRQQRAINKQIAKADGTYVPLAEQAKEVVELSLAAMFVGKLIDGIFRR